MEQKIKKPIYKRWWFWVIAVIGVLIIRGLLTPPEKQTIQTPATSKVSTPVAKPIPTPAPKPAPIDDYQKKIEKMTPEELTKGKALGDVHHEGAVAKALFKNWLKQIQESGKAIG